MDAGADATVQRIVVTPTTLEIPEGTMRTLDVLLASEPSAPVVVSLASTSAGSVAVSPGSITFTGGLGGNWSTPVQVAVSAPVDKNNVSETATITISGDGAGDPVSVPATVQDATVVKQYGWPSPPTFTGAGGVEPDLVLAVPITIEADTNLDAFGVFSRIKIQDSLYRMALYRDFNNLPGQLVAQMTAPVVLGEGVARFDVQPDVAIDTLATATGQRFWLAFEASMGANLWMSTTATTTVCLLAVPNVTDPWPTAFDPTRCSTRPAINIWIDTYHQ